MPKQSSDTGTALFLSPEAPYPVVGGGAMRSASLLKYLCAHYEVDAVFFAQAGCASPAAAIPAGDLRRTIDIELPKHSRGFAAKATRNGVRLLRRRPPLFDRFSGHEARVAEFVKEERYEVAVIEHFWCAPYVTAVRGAAAKTVLDLHNIESAWHETAAQATGGLAAWAHRSFAKEYQRLEQRWIPEFTKTLVTSAEDGAKIAAWAKQVVVYPNAIPQVAEGERVEDQSIVFSGNLEFEPNRAAVSYFYERIWPRVREQAPGVIWRIVGKNPDAVRPVVGGKAGIELIGPVDNALEWLGKAQVAVVPLRAGSGTRVKILEAWAAGTPVVSTSIGAEGLTVVAGKELLIADGEQNFAEAVLALLGSPGLRREVGEAGRSLCRKRYTWETAWACLGSHF